MFWSLLTGKVEHWGREVATPCQFALAQKIRRLNTPHPVSRFYNGTTFTFFYCLLFLSNNQWDKNSNIARGCACRDELSEAHTTRTRTKWTFFISRWPTIHPVKPRYCLLPIDPVKWSTSENAVDTVIENFHAKSYHCKRAVRTVNGYALHSHFHQHK